MERHIELFSCPICHEAMTIRQQGSVVCQGNHSFDIAKQGYVNFMTHPATTKYSKDLFTSRQRIIESGLYDTLQKRIAELVSGARLILDTGCGEGSHLARICHGLDHEVVGVGIDIAKEGIMAAARNYRGKIWCVGDLAKSPFRASSFDVILNILSPANYEEFKRLLVPGGMVVKVVPQSGYLQELRAQLYAASDKETYSNEQTVTRFYESFEDVQVERVTYTMPIAQELVSALLEMTPMGWHTEKQQSIELKEVTIDLDILVGRL